MSALTFSSGIPGGSVLGPVIVFLDFSYVPFPTTLRSIFLFHCLPFRLRCKSVHALETDGCLPTTSYSVSTRQSCSFSKKFLTSTGLLCHCVLEHSTKNKAVTLTDKQLCKACENSDPSRVMSRSTVVSQPED